MEAGLVQKLWGGEAFGMDDPTVGLVSVGGDVAFEGRHALADLDFGAAVVAGECGGEIGKRQAFGPGPYRVGKPLVGADVADGVQLGAVEKHAGESRAGGHRFAAGDRAVDILGFEAEEGEELVGGGVGALDIDCRLELAAGGVRGWQLDRFLEEQRQLAGGDDLDAWDGLDVADEIEERFVGGFGRFGGAAARHFVAFGRGIVASEEVDAVPEFGGGELGGVEVGLNDAAFSAEGIHHAGEFLVGGGEGLGFVDIGAEGEAFQVENVEHAAKPEGLAVEAHLAAIIHIHGHAPAAECDVGGGAPGVAGLAVAAGEDAEDALQIAEAGFFAAGELLDGFERMQDALVGGRGGRDAVVVGVVADVVAGESPDDVAPVALFQAPGLFAHHFERSADPHFFEGRGEAEGSVVTGGVYVVFGVEPEEVVDGLRLGKEGEGKE